MADQSEGQPALPDSLSPGEAGRTAATPVSTPGPSPLAVTLHVIEQVRQRQTRPTATYRLQLHAGFTLHDAAALVPYLHDLGISHVYCSPYLTAKRGSMHGYDLCDHNQINPELGGEAAYREFAAALARHGMGHILDMVPNHMAASTQNAWWSDVLENGPNSPFAHFFDIDWHPVKDELTDKLLLPILGQQYGEVLEQRQLVLEFREGAFLLCYFDNELPLSPKSVVPLLEDNLEALRTEMGDEHPELVELESIITAIVHLPSQTARELASVRERQREKEVVKRRLRDLTAFSGAVRRHIERNVAHYNGNENDPHSLDPLDHLLNEQPYRLAHWRAASDEINYRRFFDINELAAISMEAPDVFWKSHALVRSLLADGSLSGLRIDHIDGLFDPERYLLRLQWAYLADLGKTAFEKLTAETPSPTEESSTATSTSNGHRLEWSAAAREVLRLTCEQLGLPPPQHDDWRAILGPEAVAETVAGDADPISVVSLLGKQPLYVLTEKILGPDEPLPETWPIAGTTGYDFLATLNGVFVQASGWDEIVRGYRRFTDENEAYEDVVQDSKRLILRVAMSSELQMLAHRLNRISEQQRRLRDLTLNALRLAAREVLVHFPVYRVYPRKEGVSERDRRFVDFAVAKAKRANPEFDSAVFDFLRNVLLLNHPPELTPAAIAERDTLAGRFQQVTSPVMAKGVEDTSFYVWVPLASVNEVGGDPRRPTTSTKELHDHNQERLLRYRHAMLATTTHDTKRTEDVRARLNVLSEIPRDWQSAVQRFTRINKRFRRDVEGERAPTAKDEYLYYQSLLGIWPLSSPGARPSADQRAKLVERLQAYMEKATHEAKQKTSWINPSPAYDEAVRDFVKQTLRDSPHNKFLAELQTFHERVVDGGQYNALAQLVIKLLSPGVPDIYQGQELWDYSLVDPDNRRPVDYGVGRDQAAGFQAEIEFSGLRDSRLKHFVTQRLLQTRRRLSHLWLHGDYVPLEVTGLLAEHMVAFGWRGAESRQIELVAAVPRFLQKLIDAERANQALDPNGRWPLRGATWDGTFIVLPAGIDAAMQNVFTSHCHTVGEPALPASVLLGDFPVGVMELCSS